MSDAPGGARLEPRVTVSPEEFTHVRYEADTIARLAAETADLLGITNPIHVVVDERTPLAKMRAEVHARTSDAIVTLHVESGALEDTRRFTHFGERNARESLGRILLRARDRLREDFADVPDDRDLSHRQSAAWDASCAGRLARAGLAVSQQRWRYNFRNRFGFSDAVDAEFDRWWAADEVSGDDLRAIDATEATEGTEGTEGTEASEGTEGR